MSHFFSQTEEDTKEEKRTNKLLESSSEEEKISKKDSKLSALKLELLEAQENPSNKNIDKALRTIQKNMKLLKNNPPFLVKFFTSIDSAKKVSKSIKEKAKDIYEKMTETIVIDFKKEKKQFSLQERIIDIINLKDCKTKIIKLEELQAHNPAEKFKILLTKVLVFLQNRYLNDLIACFKEIKNIYDVEETVLFNEIDLKKLFISQFTLYFNFLINYKEEELINELASILRCLDEETVKRKMLEYKYLIKNEYLFTDIFDYKLMYFVKNDKLEEAIQFYKENKSDFKIEEQIIKLGLHELARKCFDHNEYLLSFEIYQDLFNHEKSEEVEEILFALCAIIPSKLKDQKFFEHFIDCFLAFENEMLLKSCRKKEEIFRAFFYKESGNYAMAERILLENGFHAKVEQTGSLIK